MDKDNKRENTSVQHAKKFDSVSKRKMVQFVF